MQSDLNLSLIMSAPHSHFNFHTARSICSMDAMHFARYVNGTFKTFIVPKPLVILITCTKQAVARRTRVPPEDGVKPNLAQITA